MQGGECYNCIDMANPGVDTATSAAIVRRTVRVLVADDQNLIREGVRLLLESRAGYSVCGEAANGQEAVEKARELQPDLLILDVTMPVLNGFDAARMIRKFCPLVPILILSMHNSRQLVEEARKIGVQGYVTKMNLEEQLVNAARAVLDDETFFPLI
jgi:two-component system nitrate/nitrite response regulator NarL